METHFPAGKGNGSWKSSRLLPATKAQDVLPTCFLAHWSHLYHGDLCLRKVCLMVCKEGEIFLSSKDSAVVFKT